MRFFLAFTLALVTVTLLALVLTGHGYSALVGAGFPPQTGYAALAGAVYAGIVGAALNPVL